MKNTPLSSIKVSDATFKKLHEAVEKSGLPNADVRRAALRIGLDLLEKVGYDIDGFMSSKAIELSEKLDSSPDHIPRNPRSSRPFSANR